VKWKDDGGLTWKQVVALAESAQDSLRSLWHAVPDGEVDENDAKLSDFTLAEIHLGRLIKRAKVMAEREGEPDR
jgi:hypothetical protein